MINVSSLVLSAKICFFELQLFNVALLCLFSRVSSDHCCVLIILFPPSFLFFAYLSSFLYSLLWTPPFSLTLTPACQLFPIPSGKYVSSRGVNRITFLMLFVYQCSGQSPRITSVKLELSTHTLFLHECGLLPLSCSISVSVVWQKGLPTWYSRAGLRKVVSCGGLRPRPFSPPSSLGSCQPKVFPLSD